MEKPKFTVRPGWIISKNDGDRHWISAQQLIRLYGVDPRYCLIINDDPRSQCGMIPADLPTIDLFPQYDGNYQQFWNEPNNSK